LIHACSGAIKSFNDEAAINIIAGTFNEVSFWNCYQPAINPINKIIDLYERMLKMEQEKNALLEKIINEKKNDI
jgi:hypothetical protein